MRSKAKLKLHSSCVQPDLGAANIISVVKLQNLPAPNSPQPEGKKKKKKKLNMHLFHSENGIQLLQVLALSNKNTI